MAIWEDVNTEDLNVVEKLLENLIEIDERVEFPQGENLILVIDQTDSDESNITDFIASNTVELNINEVVGSNFKIDDLKSKMFFENKSDSLFFIWKNKHANKTIGNNVLSEYFLRKALENTSSIKVIIALPYTSIKEDAGHDFILTVDEAIQFLGDTKLNKSVGVVVTDSQNEWKEPNPELIIEIANTINEIKNTLNTNKTQTTNPGETVQKEKVIYMIETILSKTADFYENISIFKKSHVFYGSLMLQNEHELLLPQDIVFNYLQFSRITDVGFKDTHSERLKSSNFEAEIMKKIQLDFTKIKRKIIENFDSFEKESMDLSFLQRKCSTLFIELKKLRTNTGDLEIFAKSVFHKLNDLNIDVKQDYFLEIIKNNAYLKFYKMMGNIQSDAKNQIYSDNWKENISGILHYLDTSKTWYHFLDAMLNLLSDYQIQRNRNIYNINALVDQLTIDDSKVLKLSNTSFKNLLVNLTKHNEYNVDSLYDDIKDVSIGGEKLRALVKLLNDTLNYKIEKIISRDNSNIIRGQYVLFSEVKKLISDDMKNLEIHAINTIFVDDDLVAPGIKLLSLTAPSVHAIGDRTISLDGRPNTTKPKNKPPSGEGPSMRGADGAPGLPGENAGNFMMISDKMMGGNIRVTAIGGSGSAGQDGGDGTAAAKGEDPPNWNKIWHWKDTEYHKKFIDKTWRYKGFRVDCKTDKTNIYFPQVECTVYGKMAKAGGEGGSGGAGGRGGSGGKAFILDLSNSKKLTHFSQQGTSGPGGKGGQGGSGAANGKWGSQKLMYSSYDNRRFFLYSDLHDYGTSSPGKSGTNGNNTAGISDPQPAVFENLSYVINNFKNFLRENLKRNERELYLWNFITNIESHPDVLNVYDTMGLVNELEGLENQFHKLHKEIPLISFYQSILNRIEVYSKNPKEVKENIIIPEYKKVLSYLYSATLSKACGLKNGKTDLIIDIPEYLKETQTNIEKIKDIINDAGKIEYYTEFSNEIEKEKDKAKHILDTRIVPQIEVIDQNIQMDLKLLINEVKQRIIDQQEKIEHKEEDIIMLKRKLWISGSLETLNILAQSLMTFGCVQLQILGSFMTGVSAIGSLVFNSINNVKKDELLMPLLKDISGTTKEITLRANKYFSLSKSSIEKVITEIQKEINVSNKTEISNLTELKKTLIQLEKELNNTKDIKGVNEIKEKLLKAVEEEEHNHSQEKEVMKWLDRLSIAIQIPVQIINASDNILNDLKSLGVQKIDLQLLIKEKLDLEAFESVVYNNMIPECKNLEKQLKEIIQDLQNKSHVQLDLAKWEVWNVIKDIQYTIRKLTEKYFKPDHLMHSFEKLDETMSTIINLYDRMVSVNEKARLITYLQDLSSKNALAVKVPNPQLNKAVNTLNVILKTNIILERYDRAMDVFSQYVFPFANMYLEEYSLSTNANLSNTPDDLIPVAIQKIEDLRNKIIESRITVGKYEKYIHKNVPFNSEYPQLKPFYTWKYEDNKITINKLLQGDEITIRADVNHGIDGNAIKFNVIGMNLKATNTTVQENLDRALNNFQVTMIHSGNSYFKCDQKFYSVSTDELTFSYFFKRDRAGRPINRNAVYDKIANNDFMLSPYTLWRIKLSNVIESNNYDILQNFKNEFIDIELIGRGQYIESNLNDNNICSHNLGNYYKEDYSSIKLSDNSLDGINSKALVIRLNDELETSHGRPELSDFYSIKDAYFGISRFFHKFMSLWPYNAIKKFNNYGLLNNLKNPKRYYVDKGIIELKFLEDSSKLQTLGFGMEEDGDISKIGGTFLLSHNNLLLWDLLMRKLKKSELNIRNTFEGYTPAKKELNDSYSHELAYGYYIPEK